MMSGCSLGALCPPIHTKYGSSSAKRTSVQRRTTDKGLTIFQPALPRLTGERES